MTLRDQLRADILDLCFNTDDFATSITHVPEIGESYQIPVLKRTLYQDAEPGTSVPVMSSDTPFRVPLDKVRSEFGPKCRIVVDGAVFKIRKSEVDKQKVTVTLHLAKA